MFLSKTGDSIAIRNLKRWGNIRLGVIESNSINQENREKTKLEQQINKQWLKSLKNDLEKGLVAESVMLAKLQGTVFTNWKKYNFLNKYTLAHVHIFKQCEGVSEDVAKLIEKIVFDSYKSYEEATGNKVKIISRITIGGR